jgi:putative CocE/NonD family hydrolase
MDEPPVKLEIRTGGSRKPYAFRFEDDWPIPRTQWTKMHLHIADKPAGEIAGQLKATPAEKTSSTTYPAGAGGHGHHAVQNGVSFETAAMTEDTEITGPLMLNVWVSSTSEDADIFVTLRNIAPDGKDVCEVGQRGEPVASVTKGWLRASHRKLDEKKSLPYRPYHAHDRRQWLKPDEIVECQVEIWPTSMVYKKGHKLRLDVTPRDGHGTQHFGHYHADYNAGAENTIYSGGDKPSYLLLPVIPPT